jgi:hypothetical protein
MSKVRKKPSTTIAFYIEDDNINWLRLTSDREKRSLSFLVNEIITKAKEQSK